MANFMNKKFGLQRILEKSKKNLSLLRIHFQANNKMIFFPQCFFSMIFYMFLGNYLLHSINLDFTFFAVDFCFGDLGDVGE